MTLPFRLLLSASLLIAGLRLQAIAFAAEDARRPTPAEYRPPDLKTLAVAGGDLRGPIEPFEADRGNLTRFYDVPGSPSRDQAFRQFYAAWLSALDALDFDQPRIRGTNRLRSLTERSESRGS